MAHLPAKLRQEVAERAGYRCEYCYGQELVTGGPLHVDHILPEKSGGPTELDNLAFSCARCNLYKGAQTRYRDPVSSRVVPLFNPRRQKWTRHFRWSDDGTRIIGRTRAGRATVIALHMNHTTIVLSRSVWGRAGIHPPD